jgi:hypothetical protein
MKKDQLHNLIDVSLLFLPISDSFWVKQNYDYISEKWEKYIGVYPIKTDVELSHSISHWKKLWGIEGDRWEKIKVIIYYLDIISETDNGYSLTNIVEKFEEITGIDPNTINPKRYNHLHPVLEKLIGEWLETPKNKREFNLILLTQD